LQVLEETPPAQKQVLPWLVTRNWVLLALGQDSNAQEGITRGLAAARTPDLLLQDAFLKVKKKDLKGALSAVDEALTQKPDELRGWRLLGDISTAQKQFPKALERLRQTAAQYPRSAPLQYLLGTWQVNAQQRPAARTAFLAAKAADPRFYAADLAVAQLDLADNQPDSARRVLNSVISVSPRNAPARLLLGMIDEQAGQRDAAISHYRAVVDTDDKNVVALNNLAYLLVTTSPAEALKYAQQAVALNSEVAALQDTLGWAYYHNGLYGSAVKHLEEAVAKESTGRRKYHLGMAYLKRGDRELAEKTLKAALEMDPKLAASEPELRSLRK